MDDQELVDVIHAAQGNTDGLECEVNTSEFVDVENYLICAQHLLWSTDADRECPECGLETLQRQVDAVDNVLTNSSLIGVQNCLNSMTAEIEAKRKRICTLLEAVDIGFEIEVKCLPWWEDEHEPKAIPIDNNLLHELQEALWKTQE